VRAGRDARATAARGVEPLAEPVIDGARDLSVDRPSVAPALGEPRATPSGATTPGPSAASGRSAPPRAVAERDSSAGDRASDLVDRVCSGARLLASQARYSRDLSCSRSPGLRRRVRPRRRQEPRREEGGAGAIPSSAMRRFGEEHRPGRASAPYEVWRRGGRSNAVVGDTRPRAWTSIRCGWPYAMARGPMTGRDNRHGFLVCCVGPRPHVALMATVRGLAAAGEPEAPRGTPGPCERA
jgi:hypothetical protein